MSDRSRGATEGSDIREEAPRGNHDIIGSRELILACPEGLRHADAFCRCDHDIGCDRLPHSGGTAEKFNFLMSPGNHAIPAHLVAVRARSQRLAEKSLSSVEAQQVLVRKVSSGRAQ